MFKIEAVENGTNYAAARKCPKHALGETVMTNDGKTDCLCGKAQQSGG